MKKKIIKILKIIINKWNKNILELVYWIIENSNKNKTSSHKQVEQLRLGILKDLALKIKNIMFQLLLNSIKYVKKIVKVVYEILKIEYWPHRYYILLYILFITTFTMDMITYSRVIRFIVTCFILLSYKKLHVYIEKNNSNFNINIKYIVYLMWINTIQNPVLYMIWKWDLYVYEKYEKKINKIIKKNKLKKVLILLFWNISMPIKIIYMRLYKTLNIIKKLTFKEFMFSRVYGFLVSVLIFSNIIKYILNITGGLLNLILSIYIIMYCINLLYTLYNMQDLKIQKADTIKILIQKTVIYKIMEDYLFTLKNLEINQIYEYKISASIIGCYIKNYLMYNFSQLNKAKFFINYLDEITEQWRYWIYNNRLSFKILFYISYKDLVIKSSLIKFKYDYILKNYKNLDIYYNTYIEAINCLTELFKMYESVLYYKYYVLKKGVIEKYSNSIKNLINMNEYEDIYIMYFLILKNIIFYIWSYEYYIFQNKNKLTKFYVIEDATLEFGYHIYSKDINQFNAYDNFKPMVTEMEILFNKKLINIKDNKSITEKIYILSKLINLTLPNTILFIFIESKENQELKNINKLYNKYFNLISINDNDISLLKTEIASEYFMELKNIMDILYKEWEQSYSMNKTDILENKKIFNELINHCIKF